MRLASLGEACASWFLFTRGEILTMLKNVFCKFLSSDVQLSRCSFLQIRSPEKAPR